MATVKWDWLGDPLALDLVNTVRRRGWDNTELIGSPADLREWLDRPHNPADRHQGAARPPRGHLAQYLQPGRLPPPQPARQPGPVRLPPGPIKIIPGICRREPRFHGASPFRYRQATLV